MIIDLTKLNSGIEEYTTIDLSYSFSKEELKDSEILELNDVKIYGTISKNSLNDYYLDLEISGIMVLPCAVTLKPVNHDFNIKISDNLNELLSEIDKNIKKVENLLDIFPIVWENILMEVPMRVVSSDVSDVPLEGNGWKFIKED
ncbi:MAG: DUF177 domain-containing protein [Firmicutes bacterium]|nr:DUF177 domain-containing protein [Bacillota bacterium]